MRFLFARFGFDGGSQGREMLCSGPFARIDEKLDGSVKPIIPTNLDENTFRQRFDAVARRIQQFGAEITQSRSR